MRDFIRSSARSRGFFRTSEEEEKLKRTSPKGWKEVEAWWRLERWCWGVLDRWHRTEDTEGPWTDYTDGPWTEDTEGSWTDYTEGSWTDYTEGSWTDCTEGSWTEDTEGSWFSIREQGGSLVSVRAGRTAVPVLCQGGQPSLKVSGGFPYRLYVRVTVVKGLPTAGTGSSESWEPPTRDHSPAGSQQRSRSLDGQ